MLRVKQLICDSLNGIRIAQTILAAAIHIPNRSPRRLSGWELEHRDCRAIPGRGFLLTGETARGEVLHNIKLALMQCFETSAL